MEQHPAVEQVILEKTGTRPERCRRLLKTAGLLGALSVWWARSRDGREWMLIITPGACSRPISAGHVTASGLRRSR